MLRARRDRLAQEREWEATKARASALGFDPAANLRPAMPPPVVPGGRKFTVKPTGTIEYYD